MRSEATKKVLIVSRNPDTLEQLQGYLDRAGMSVGGSRTLEMPPVDRSTRAVVLFPDDFTTADVRHLIARTLMMGVRIIIVTNEPRRFGFDESSSASSPIFIPKPAWGWRILDAVYERVDA